MLGKVILLDRVIRGNPVKGGIRGGKTSEGGKGVTYTDNGGKRVYEEGTASAEALRWD